MRLGLRTKITLVTVLSTTMVIGLFYFFIVREVRKILQNSAINRGMAIAESLVEQVQQGVDQGAMQDLRSTFGRIARLRKEVVYMFLINKSGKVMVHSDPRAEGLEMHDPITKAALHSEQSLVQRYRADLGRDQQLESVYDIAVPVFSADQSRWGSLRIGISFRDRVADHIRSVTGRITLLSISGLLLAIILASLVSLLLVRPISRLIAITQEVEKGNLKREFDFPKTQDEIGALASSFSRMLERLKEGYERIEKISITDALTGCYNYHYFQQIMDQEIVRANRYQHPVSLIILDLDGFKALNDRWGHLKGNEVLKTVSSVIANTIRQTDILVRYGGDEFIILLPETDLAGAVKEAERVRREVQKRCVFAWDTSTVTITISVGVAGFSKPPMDKGVLLDKADRALLRSKGQGKNRVEIAGE